MKSKLILLGLMMILLNACTWNTPDASTREMVYPINNPYESQAWTEEPKEAAPLPKFVKTAEVPQVQMSAKNLDLEWVRQQNPKDYTIMLAANPQPLLISQRYMYFGRVKIKRNDYQLLIIWGFCKHFPSMSFVY